MLIEIAEIDFRGIQDSVGEIKALVVRARMGPERDRAGCLQEITLQANAIIARLNNGELAETGAPGASG